MASRQTILLVAAGVLTLVVLGRLTLSSTGASTPIAQQTNAQLHATAMDTTRPMTERQGALALLASRGRDGVTLARKVLAAADEPELRAHSLLVLSDAGDAQSVDTMITALTDNSPHVRHAADQAVARMLGGVRITIGDPDNPTLADRQRQAAYYRNLWLTMNQSSNVDALQDRQQGIER